MNLLTSVMRRAAAIVCVCLALQMSGTALAQSSRPLQRVNIDAWIVVAGAEFTQRITVLSGAEFTGAAVVPASAAGAIVAAMRDSEQSGELEIINQAKLSTVNEVAAEMQIKSEAATRPDSEALRAAVARSFKLIVTPESSAGDEVTLTLELTLAATANVAPTGTAAAAVRDVRTLSSKASMRMGDTFILQGPLSNGRDPTDTARGAQERELLLVVRPRLEAATRR